MKGSITQLAAGLAVAALIVLPVSAAAQMPPSQPPAQAPQHQPHQASAEAAREHLAKAKAALADINTSSLSTRVNAQITELNRRMNALERAMNDQAGTTAHATSGARDSSTWWGSDLAAIDTTLAALLGPESHTTGTPAPVGTSGSAASSGAIAIDEITRAKLMETRGHLRAFATAMVGGAAQAQTQPQPPTTSAQSGQRDEQAARRHLTDARNTLSAITQLPAATQLTGDTRSQVSQLISNFNELITSQSNWRDAYAKVSANLNALIGSESGVTTDPTAGAVGTSGDASLDPEIRSRLVELRRQLHEYEKAAGGTVAPSASATMNPAATDPNAPAPPATTTPPSTPPSTAPAAGTAPPSSTASGSAASAEVMRHLEAIEALLKTEDDSGGVTLTKAQLEQLRLHLASLRQGLSK